MQDHTNPFSLPHWRGLAANLVLLAMFTLTVALYALLMLRDRIPLPGLAGLAALGLAHYVLAGWRRPTPLDLPILVLLGLLPLSLAVTTLSVNNHFFIINLAGVR